MEYDLDLDVAHVIDWLKREAGSGGKRLFDVTANRTFVVDGTTGEFARIGDEEHDLESICAVGILEVRPLADSGGHWLLSIRIEDIIGPHLPEDGSVPDEPEEMTLEGFEEEFVLPDRGTAYVTVELQNDQDRSSFDRLMGDVATDRHEFE